MNGYCVLLLTETLKNCKITQLNSKKRRNSSTAKKNVLYERLVCNTLCVVVVNRNICSKKHQFVLQHDRLYFKIKGYLSDRRTQQEKRFDYLLFLSLSLSHTQTISLSVSLSHSLCLALSLSHTHTHTNRTHTHTHTQKKTHLSPFQ